MSQIISLDYQYSPKLFKWNVANISSFEKCLEYLRPDSVVLISEKFIFSDNYIKKFALLKLTFPDLFIIIISEHTQISIDKNNSLFLTSKPEDVDMLISEKRREHFQKCDKMKLYLNVSEELGII